MHTSSTTTTSHKVCVPRWAPTMGPCGLHHAYWEAHWPRQSWRHGKPITSTCNHSSVEVIYYGWLVQDLRVAEMCDMSKCHERNACALGKPITCNHTTSHAYSCSHFQLLPLPYIRTCVACVLECRRTPTLLWLHPHVTTAVLGLLCVGGSFRINE